MSAGFLRLAVGTAYPINAANIEPIKIPNRERDAKQLYQFRDLLLGWLSPVAHYQFC
jgi:hypothetical protein